MLPTHHYPPTAQTPPWLANRSNAFTKFLNRRIFLGCMVVVIIWFAGPRVGKRLWESESTPKLDHDSQLAPHIRPIQGPPLPKPEEQRIWEPRKNEVRDAFKHAWMGYKTRAFPADELRAVSGGGSDKYNGWSVTLFDSLDTMWIMGLRDDYADAVQRIKDFHFHATKPNHYAHFFEATIRYLGGLLSAYALSGDDHLLKLADELGQILILTFLGTESGLPAFSVNVKTGQTQSPYDTALFAEVASCQMEFKYLAKLTGTPEYYKLAQKTMNLLYKANVTNGLFHEHWFMKDATPRGSRFTVGAGADSGYEYLLKQWLLSGDEQALEQYLKSAAGIIDNLIYITPKRGLMYVGDLNNGAMVHRLEHLSCFLPGVLALGVQTLDLPSDVRELHEWVAHGLTYTCAITYADQQSGLGPEQMEMTPGYRWIDEVRKWKAEGRVGIPPGLREPAAEKDAANRDYTNNWPSNLLRPETVESIFYMWKITGNVKWRERGYAIFEAINKNSRTQHGFASVEGVDGSEMPKIDDMPSYFLAETLKYLYLLFDDTHPFPFDRWVFNTEAHPLPIFSWTDWERRAFNISGV